MKKIYIIAFALLLVSCGAPPVPEAIIAQQAADMQAARDSRITSDALALQQEIDRRVNENSLDMYPALTADINAKNAEIIRLNNELRSLENRSFNNYFFFGVIVLILLGITVALVVALISKPTYIPNQSRTANIVRTNYPISHVNSSTQLSVTNGFDTVIMDGESYRIPMEVSQALRNIINS